MHLKLSYKLFAAFFMLALTLLGFLLLLQYSASRNFTTYVHQNELRRLAPLIKALAEIYQIEQTWEGLQKAPGRWFNLFIETGLIDQRPPPHEPPDMGTNPPIRPKRPPSPDGPPSPGRRPSPGGPPPLDDPFQHPPPDHFPIERQQEDGFLLPKVTLFNAQKEYVTGRKGRLEKFIVRPITIGQTTVGWIGLLKHKRLSAPLEMAFMEQQYKLFYFVGCGMLILTSLLTLILSRQIVTPIKALRQGTKSLIDRQFKTRLMITSNDELGQLAADFNLMAASLKRYEELRKQWIADISHELRTPLAILRGEIEAIQDGIREANPETLASLHAELLHIIKIVDDLYHLSLADSQNLTFRKDLVPPLEILSETIDLFQSRFNQSKIEIIPPPPQDADRPLIVIGDGDRLKQLFSNILENTLKYMERPGEMRIWHRTEHNRLYLFFEDSGPGVPADAIDRLFDRLYRVDKSRSRQIGGSGLGLSICKQIVEAHEGQILAKNSPEKGLLIQIEFPLTAKE